jgi:hypothetical protein
VNLYAYVGNSSMIYTDRFGREKISAYQFSIFETFALWYTDWYIDFLKWLASLSTDIAFAPGSHWEIDSSLESEDNSYAMEAWILIWWFISPGKKAQVVEDIVGSVAKKYDNFECMPCAKEIWEKLDELGDWLWKDNFKIW